MQKTLTALALAGALTSGLVAAEKKTPAAKTSAHAFTVKDIDGKDVSLAKFKDQVLMVVNVASL